MKASKMASVLHELQTAYDVPLSGLWIGASGGGEVYFSFSSQPDTNVHKYLTSRGFVLGGMPFDQTSYVYRP